MNIRCHAYMGVGPRKNQQDCLLIHDEIVQEEHAHLTRSWDVSQTAMLVCDGMGGLHGGELASRFVCTRFKEAADGFYHQDRVVPSLADIQNAFDGVLPGNCGTTIAGIVIRKQWAMAFNIGDSRVYRLAPGPLRLLTHDHSLVQVLVDQGQITETEAFYHPHRNLITAGIGTAFADRWSEDDIWLHDLDAERSATFLICSDGVHDLLMDHMIESILGEDPMHRAAALADALDEAGLRDNTSFLLVDIDTGESSEQTTGE